MFLRSFKLVLAHGKRLFKKNAIFIHQETNVYAVFTLSSLILSKIYCIFFFSFESVFPSNPYPPLWCPETPYSHWSVYLIFFKLNYAQWIDFCFNIRFMKSNSSMCQ